MQIGELSDLTGVKIETIRYYEKIGLMPSPPRTEGGRRIYDPDHVNHLASIRRCRELGFTLNEVRKLLGLVEGGYTCGEVSELTLHHQNSIKRKIADLKRLNRKLGILSEKCNVENTSDCPVIDTLFERNRRP